MLRMAPHPPDEQHTTAARCTDSPRVGCTLTDTQLRSYVLEQVRERECRLPVASKSVTGLELAALELEREAPRRRRMGRRRR
jgi:hypothetical protein